MKSRCRSIQRYLSDYIDCTLSGRQTVTIAQHLRSCRVCRVELESLRRTRALLRFYVSPQPPEGYHDRFWYQLQEEIDKRPGPMWHQASLFPQDLVWKFHEALNRSLNYLSKSAKFTMDRIRVSPVYVSMLLAVLASLLAHQLFSPQDEGQFRGGNLRHALTYPVQPMKTGENRELISNRERSAKISQSLTEQSVQEGQKLSRQSDIVESSAGYLPSLANDSDVLNTVAIRDSSPDLATNAQLSTPDFLVAKEDFFQPLGAVITPFPVRIGWVGNRSLNRFADLLMNVPVPNLSITEVYDSVKL